MRFKLLTVAAATLLLAACESAPEDTGMATGGGATNTGASTASETIAQPAAGSQEELLVQVGDRVFFDYDRSDVRGDQQPTLDKLAAWLQRNPGVQLLIEGHADERGTREYNLALGERRANSVREFLIAAGVDSARLNNLSYGEERPAVLGSNEQSWAQNRRAVFVVR
jgi:peptidoglycan-associated lipoprotein